MSSEIEPEKFLLDGTLNFDVDEWKKLGVQFVMMRIDGVIREIPLAFINVELQPQPVIKVHKVYWSKIDGLGHAVPYSQFLQIEREKREKMKR